ncbi:MAG: hypothetical protein ACKVWR_22480 [Acidimicrobiales bacterium]
MAHRLVKTSVTVPADEDLERAAMEYEAAFAEWDETAWDHLAGEGLDPR